MMNRYAATLAAARAQLCSLITMLEIGVLPMIDGNTWLSMDCITTVFSKPSKHRVDAMTINSDRSSE
ncbi:hypothetical protein LZ023_35155 (plasmid) [Pseudomonas silvicola]|nr:hypothetical protein LZ023_35155 [Pseudomonas silvicola]